MRALSVVAVGAAALTTFNAPAQAIPAEGDSEPSLASEHHVDDIPHPLGQKQRELREKAVTDLVQGKATVQNRNGGQVIKAGEGQYVQYDVNREESIFTILTDFGTEIDPEYGGEPGPVHNEIEQPDRDWDGDSTDDNSTAWKADYDRDHYMDLMFGPDNSLKDFYLAQSNGKFLAKGDVSDWVSVPYNEARYGSNEGSSAATYWPYIRDTAQAWYDDQVAQGKSDAEIRDYLSQFDQWDRYDHDGDGDFNEPDGYIDHFQAIHAGEGEEAGGGAQGSDAIWSHRWYAYSNGIGSEGPEGNKLGGVPLGDSGIWIGDYTTEPENGGVGVFTHEFAHDLGLPDLYDTRGGDNGTGFWTLMSSGSWLNDGGEDIGTKPGYMGAWEKLQLGWLDAEFVEYGEDTRVKLGPADRTGRMPQAVVVNLPDYTKVTEYNTPKSGEYEWWSTADDNLNTTLTRSLDLTGATSASLTTAAWYQIEAGYDYLYTEVSTDGGQSWTKLDDGLDGSSGGEWTELSWDLSEYAGQVIDFRFRYQTDGGWIEDGAFLDDISLVKDGSAAWTDDVEAGEGEWTADGFTRMTGSITEEKPQYYLAENRVYSGYDSTLEVGPYNFGWSNSRPDWVERFPYQNGLLVWYANEAYADNNTSVHPGYGQVLPVDARPEPITFPGGALLGNRRQPFDATFGQEATDPVTFHRNGVPTSVPSQPAMPTFDDSDVDRYWSEDNPWSSTKVAGTGTTLTVDDTGMRGDMMMVDVRFK